MNDEKLLACLIERDFMEYERYFDIINAFQKNVEKLRNILNASSQLDRRWLRRTEARATTKVDSKNTNASQSLASLLSDTGDWLDTVAASQSSGEFLVFTEHGYAYQGEIVDDWRNGVGILSTLKENNDEKIEFSGCWKVTF